MINIHLYPSQFRSESRILRGARTLSALGLFASIDLLGTGGADLDAEERLGGGIRIRRLTMRREDVGLIGKVLDALKWSAAVYTSYRNQNVACINCHSVATLPIGCMLKWSTGARLVYDAHELETETSGLRGIRKLGTKLVERALIRYVDYSVFVGAAIDDWYRRTYKLRNTAVVYNSPIFSTLEATDIFRQTYAIEREVPIFLYQGVLSAARGIPKLVEAMKELDGVALVVMGYGELGAWVANEAEQQGNIFFHPAVPPDELLKYTASADYGLSVIESTSLSYEYCMPNKLFEYLMAGKPVLVSPTREQRSLVERYGVGVVLVDTSVDSIRRGMRELLSLDHATLLAAIDVVREEFCWERQEQTLAEIYTKHLGLARRFEGPR